MLHVLAKRNITFFLIARLVLELAKKISWIAIAWFVYQLTNSASAIGFVITAATISPLISSVFAGVVLDQFNRRTLMVVENGLRGMFLLLIPLLYWGDLLMFSSIVIIIFLNGFLSAFTDIGSTTILPAFVAKEELESANAMLAITGQSGYLIGPAIGGFLSGFLGAPITLIITVVLFLLASFLYFLIPNEIFHQDMTQQDYTLSWKEKIAKIKEDTKEGFAFLKKHRILIVIASVTLVFNVTYAPLEPVLPVFVGKNVNGGPSTLGLIWTVFAVGALIGSFIWVRLKMDVYYSYSLGVVISLWGIAPVIMSQFTNETIIYIIMFFGGVVYAPYNIVEPTLEQQLVPDKIRGRVLGVLGMIAGIGFPVGTFLGGLLGEFIGPSLTIFLSGMFTIVLGVFVFRDKSLRLTPRDVN
ncbi:MFS transporter [Pontibacillus yanchengensis]|nr:MFS transporter [Pontibacillus yanchengensis]